MKIISRSANQTKKIAGKLAKEIIKKGPAEKAVVLALQGDLGSGKTTFLQGFAKGLGISEVVNSPTFVIFKKFKIQNLKGRSKTQKLKVAKQFANFYHFDCYRVDSSMEMEAMGLKEIMASSQNIVAIEWPERIKGALPEKGVKISLGHIHRQKTSRTVDILENL